MALIEHRLIGYLANDSAIAALIASGSPSINRITPERVPQNSILPAIAYNPVGGPIRDLLDGNPDLRYAAFQFTCCATTATAAWGLGYLIMLRMSGVGGDEFQKVEVEDQGSTDEEEPGRYNRIVVVTIAYAESSP